MTKFLAGPSHWALHYPDDARPKRSYGLRSGASLAAAAQVTLYPRAGEGGSFHLDASIGWIAAAAGEPALLADFLGAIAADVRAAGATEVGCFSRNELGIGWFGIPESWDHVLAGCRAAGFEPGQTWGLWSADVEAIRSARVPGYAGLTLDRFHRPDDAEHETVARIKGADAAECVIWNPPAIFSDAPDFPAWTTLELIEVQPPFRRQGLARWLLAEQARWLGPAGVRHVLSWVEADNTPAASLLAACGFRAAGTCVGMHRRWPG